MEPNHRIEQLSASEPLGFPIIDHQLFVGRMEQWLPKQRQHRRGVCDRDSNRRCRSKPRHLCRGFCFLGWQCLGFQSSDSRFNRQLYLVSAAGLGATNVPDVMARPANEFVLPDGLNRAGMSTSIPVLVTINPSPLLDAGPNMTVCAGAAMEPQWHDRLGKWTFTR